MMKKVFFAVVAMAIFVTGTMMASVEISKREKVSPVDEIWMDMAVTVAKVNVEEGGVPCGSVVVLNGRLQSSGQATEKATSVETAIAMSKMKTLRNAKIYTVNEPTIEAYNAACKAKVDAIYFVNPKEKVIAAGVQPVEAYDESKIDSTLTAIPVIQMDYEDAAMLLK
jgi:tRNA(Arg) A34 adenosine deaminase TadA